MAKMAKAENEKKHNLKRVKKHEERRNRRNMKERKGEESSVNVVKKNRIVNKPFHSAKNDNTIVKEKLTKKKARKEVFSNKTFEEKNIAKDSSNRTSTIVILVVMALLIILLVVLGVKSCSKGCDPDGVIAIGPFGSEEEPVANTGDIIRTQEAFDELFDYKETCKPNFEEHSYAVIVISYDTCQKKNLEVKRYTLDDKLLTLYMSYNGKCNACDLKYTYYLVPVPLTTDNLEIAVDYERTNELSCVLKVK